MPKRGQKKLKTGSRPSRQSGKRNLEVKILSVQKNKEINQPREENVIKPDNEKADQDKKLFMWTGVSCLMVIFLVIWILNLKNEFNASINKSAKGEFNWSQAKVELDKAMAQVKESLVEIKKLQSNPKFKALSGEPKPTAEQINLLKGKLLNEAATGTAAGTIKN